ncbi:GD17843, partial [Drosophila simulans]
EKIKETPTHNMGLSSVMSTSQKRTSETLPNEIGNIITDCSSFNTSTTDLIGIEYFDDPALIQINSDGVKTEQIQCNLQILSEEGDVVIEELCVNAQVSFK